MFQKKANAYFIHINLGTKANLSKDIKSYVLSEIPSVLKERYGVDIDEADFANTIYSRELLDFDRSVKGAWKGVDDHAYQRERVIFLTEKISNRDRHLQASLGHLAHACNKQIILVLDNADQRSFQVQQDAFFNCAGASGDPQSNRLCGITP